MSTYPRIAWATSMTSSSPEHYKNLVKHKVKNMIVCLHSSGLNAYKAGVIHTKAAKEAGMIAHAGLISDLTKPLEDARRFYNAYKKLNYTNNTRTSIFCMKTYAEINRKKRLEELLRYIACFIDRENIDIAFNKSDFVHHFDIKKAKKYNLTIFNPGRLNSEVKNAGTWVYTNTFEDKTQYLGYDFYGFYTGNTGYQLSLNDEYIAKPGDTWVTIATRHDIWLPKLLQLNNAQYDDLVVPGQCIKVQ